MAQPSRITSVDLEKMLRAHIRVYNDCRTLAAVLNINELLADRGRNEQFSPVKGKAH